MFQKESNSQPSKSQSAQANKPSTKPQAAQVNSQSANWQDSSKSWQARDIRNLVHNQGKANWNGREWQLKSPSWNDASLKEIVNDPQFTAKPAGAQAADGNWTYELKGKGKTTKITLSC